jgi:hypothetical protein
VQSDEPIEPQFVVSGLGSVRVTGAQYGDTHQFDGSTYVSTWGTGVGFQSGLAYWRPLANTSGRVGLLPSSGRFEIPISSISNANPAVVTTSITHGLSSGQWVKFLGYFGGWAPLNGYAYQITVTGATTFTIPVNTSAFGTYPTVPGVVLGGISSPTYSFTFDAVDTTYGVYARSASNYSSGAGENAVGVRAEASQSNPTNLGDSLGVIGYSTSTSAGKNTGGYFKASGAATNYGLVVEGGSRLVPVAFSALPACAAAYEGVTQAVTDSSTATWGATVTGSGSNHIKAYCDGTNWTVAAK